MWHADAMSKPGPLKVLVLGGTGEARELARRFAGRDEIEVISSLAGRLAEPALPEGAVRIGGFGGANGLAGWLVAQHVDAVIDATHPFAAAMSAAACSGCATAGVPLLVLDRPGWEPRDGDRWHRVGSLAAAAAALPSLGSRAFLTIGRQGLAVFAGMDELFFLVRAVEQPGPPLPQHMSLVLDRGPFTVRSELALLWSHRIDVLVSKDSGGDATAAKLDAARLAELPVLVIDRPPAPDAPRVHTVDEALTWLEDRLRRDSGAG
jgi:precorrin-6A/cobalt-precorrin-6A reductase